MQVKMAMLNSMAAQDFVESLDKQQRWGITELDLKDRIFEKSVIELTDAEASRAKEEISRRGMSVYCMSTQLFHDDMEKGESHFREHHLAKIGETLRIARILKPAVIRLLSARSGVRQTFSSSLEHIARHHPWLPPLYREAVDSLQDAGFAVTIENECRDDMFSSPEEIIGFFQLLDRQGKVSFTYDVQNLWQMGTYPSLDVYRALSGLIGYFHLKGGQSLEPGGELVWKSALEDAAWPVLEMTRQVVRDGISPVICLNPSHGQRKEDYDYDGIVERDLDFIRKHIPEVE